MKRFSWNLIGMNGVGIGDGLMFEANNCWL